ncbi:MAG: hypothetical protein ABI647_19675 [Gemmatimonadota bacterium]
MKTSPVQLSLPVVLVFAAACGRSPAGSKPEVRLFTDLGSLHVPITTRSEPAQAYFDQGMRLTYAFNHGEAIRSFEEAARQDPDCAICQWGIALAFGPNINAPMDSAGGVAAWRAVEQARRLIGTASPRERALIEALGTRYAAVPPEARDGLDSAYATALAGVVAKFPDDLEAATLYAESLMDLRPWNYWNADRSPAAGTETLLHELERVVARDSTHPGACHFYIHAVEAAYPERALPCAERLARLMPGAGHLVHMPAHIYVRVGRYADAIEHNEHATHADSAFAAVERPSMTYAALYVPHNFHFLSFAALLAGREATALTAARETVAKTPPEAMLGVPEYQPMLVFDRPVLAKFGRWQELLERPLPSADFPVALGVAESFRGTALAATGRVAEAVKLLDSVTARAAATPEGIPRRILEIARHSLAGEIAARRHQLRVAEQEFRAAMVIEDGLGYMEPPWWALPVRQALGAVLLEAGKPAEAERIYREDLVRFPKNVWSLAGLVRSLEARKSPGLEVARAELAAAGGADITGSHR